MVTEPTPTERAAMAHAVALAAATRPTASPNPTVGCVVIDDGEVVGTGASEPAGGRHAEVLALARAGARARGATAVVTLEPCAHHGRTPPCTDALVAAGVARAVVGVADANPLAAGGAEALRAAGIAVAGPLDGEAVLGRAIALELAGTLATHRSARPSVTLKLAQRSDGALVALGGERWITGPAARRAVHRDRARADAVLVGVGTVLADDPRLDARDPGDAAATSRAARGGALTPGAAASAVPRAVVLDPSARTPSGANVVRPGTLVLVAPDAPPARVAGLAAGGASVRTVARGPRGLDLAAALAALVEEGITTVLAEPGPTLAGALLRSGSVDRLVLHVAGAAGAAAVPAVALDGWRVARRGGAGPDRIVELVPDARSLGGATAEAA